MLSGELPFVSEGMGELFDMQMNRPPTPLEKKVPGVNPALAATIEKMLRKDPAERVQTMGEVQRALLASASAAASAPTRPRVATPLAAVRPAAERSATNPSRTLPASANTTLSAGASEVDVDTTTVPRNRLARPLGVVAALLVATGVVFVVRSLPGLKGHDADEKTAVPVTAHAATAGTPSGPAKEAAAPAPREAPRPAHPAPEAKAPGPAAPADRIMIDLKSSPSEARVVDSASGRLIGVTPLHHRLPRQTGALEVRVEKSGYSSKSLTIPQDQDYHGSIRLERAAEAEPSGGEHIIKL